MNKLSAGKIDAEFALPKSSLTEIVFEHFKYEIFIKYVLLFKPEMKCDNFLRQNSQSESLQKLATVNMNCLNFGMASGFE